MLMSKNILILYNHLTHINLNKILYLCGIYYIIYILTIHKCTYEKRRFILLFVDDTLCT